MSINTFDFQTKLTGALDTALVQKSVTSFMLDNAFGAKFVGANSVMIPDVSFSGLGDYDRDSGFPDGAITVTNTTYTLANERARSFQLDRMDADETSIAGLAGKVMGEFVRTKVAPEMDAYILSKLADIAVTNGNTVEVPQSGSVADNCVEMLSSAINGVYSKTGYDEELVAFVNPTFYSALMSTPELARRINVADFKKGEVNTQVKKLDDTVIIPVPTARMKDKYDFFDGKSSGEIEGGFIPHVASGSGDTAAKDIGFIVLPKSAAKLVKKTEKIRTFAPDQNPEMDAYKFDYRLYYDAFVKKSAAGTIYTYVY